MTVVIKPKRSTTPSASPSGLQNGELAINIPDKKIYVGNTTGGGDLLIDGSASGTANSNIGTVVINIGTSLTTLDTVTISSNIRSVEYSVSAKDTVNNRFKFSKVNIVTDGTSSYFDEYSVIKSSDPNEVVTLSSDVSGGNLRLLGTGDSANVNVQILRVKFDSTIANTTISSFIATQNIKLATTEIDFGTKATKVEVFTITDSAVNINSNIVVQQSGAAATGRKADENEFTALTFSATPGAGAFTVYAHCVNGTVSGKHKINYIIG